MKTLRYRYSRTSGRNRASSSLGTVRPSGVESIPNIRRTKFFRPCVYFLRCSEAIGQEFSSGSGSIYTKGPPRSSSVRVGGPLRKSSTVVLVAGENTARHIQSRNGSSFLYRLVSVPGCCILASLFVVSQVIAHGGGTHRSSAQFDMLRIPGDNQANAEIFVRRSELPIQTPRTGKKRSKYKRRHAPGIRDVKPPFAASNALPPHAFKILRGRRRQGRRRKGVRISTGVQLFVEFLNWT